MKEITLITGNENKVREAQEILGKDIKVNHTKLDLPEVQAIKGEEVIGKKLEEAYKILNVPVVVEDTQLYFKAWNNLPGALIKWFLDSVGCKGICKMLHNETDREVIAETIVGYFDGKDKYFFSGKQGGIIPNIPRGDLGFGWDPIFQPNGSEKTFGEMEVEEKNEMSTRKLAFEQLAAKL